MKYGLILIALLVALPISAQNQVIPLWEGEPPYYVQSDEEEHHEVTKITRISGVQDPEIKVFLPNASRATGEAVLICPGGGYRILAWDWEGENVARMFNSHGIAAVVLKYRLPSQVSQTEPTKVPLCDAQRAMRMVRHYAKDWGISQDKIGVMGFSAGGHLASTLSTHYDKGDLSNADPIERQHCRPDFSILMYGVITMDEETTHAGSRRSLLGDNPSDELVEYYSSEKQVDEQTPPAILIHSTDDRGVPVENSLGYYMALKEHEVKAEMHIYPYGGHGFGLADDRGHLGTWPDRVVDWIKYLYR